MDLMSNALIENYYRCFNERRFADAAALFAANAEIEFIPHERECGGVGYVRFAQWWTAAFANAKFEVERIERGGATTLCEVYLLATGAHRGMLDFGAYRFKPSGADAVLHVRELLDIRDGKITVSVLTVDLNDLVGQLTHVDYDELARRVDRIRALGDELAQVVGDASRQRDVANRLALELDAARRVTRPHFNR